MHLFIHAFHATAAAVGFTVAKVIKGRDRIAQTTKMRRKQIVSAAVFRRPMSDQNDRSGITVGAPLLKIDAGVASAAEPSFAVSHQPGSDSAPGTTRSKPRKA
jgi:hypothetical protein